VHNPTPSEKLVDSQGRPCFLWDCDLTLEELQEGSKNADEPDDVFTFARVLG
jgi:hypothetical protein